MALKTKKISQITFEPGKQRSPLYYYPNLNSRILYTSNQLGSPNLYVTDRDDKTHYQITDIAGGVFEPSVDKKAKKIVFTAFKKQGYDIVIRAGLSSPDEVFEVQEKFIEFDRPFYPPYKMSIADFFKESYHSNFAVDLIFLSLFYANGIGIAGLVYTSVSDYMGDHNVSLYVDYLAGAQSSNVFFSYGYLKKE